MKTLNLPQWLLIVCAFLAPIIGGQVSLELAQLDPSALLSSLFGGPETPLLSAALVTLLCATSLILTVAKRKVLQIPSPMLSGVMAGFFALLTFSVLLSQFSSISMAALALWLSYGLAFFAVVAVLGRKVGPVAFIVALTAGCAVVAGIGLYEYGQLRFVDPNWRIFARWINPNATAGILGIGLLLSTGLTLYFRSIWSVATGTASFAIALALFLTRSKGGYASAVVALLIVAVVGVVWWAGGARRRGIVAVGTSVILFGLLALAGPTYQQTGLPLATAPQIGGTRLGGAEQEQSFTYRKNLWVGAIEIMRENAVGTGIGTYRFYSATPGITPQTHMAHESFLQLGVEASGLAPLLLLSIGVIWTWQVFRGGARLGSDQTILRLTAFGAVVCAVAHNFIDSDLYVFGTGWVFFALLGVALLISADSVVPEFTPGAMRGVIATASGLIALLCLHGGYAEMLRARARFELGRGNTEAAKGFIERAMAVSPNDGENYRLLANVATSPFDALVALRKMADLHPSSKNLRTHGNYLALNREYEEAVRRLQAALQKDPNNLNSLNLLYWTQNQMGEQDAAVQTAQRLVEVENTPYFQTRAIPEVIPVETYRARDFLADHTSDPAEKIRLLEESVAGFERYMQVTYPKLKDLAQGNLTLEYAGDSLKGAIDKMKEAQQIGRKLVALYRAAGREPDAKRVEGVVAAFGAAAESALEK